MFFSHKTFKNATSLGQSMQQVKFENDNLWKFEVI